MSLFSINYYSMYDINGSYVMGGKERQGMRLRKGTKVASEIYSHMHITDRKNLEEQTLKW